MASTYRAVEVSTPSVLRVVERPISKPGGWSSPHTRRSVWRLSYRFSEGTGRLSRPHGSREGNDFEDWLQAERELKGLAT
jgi:hypothetical protein